MSTSQTRSYIAIMYIPTRRQRRRRRRANIPSHLNPVSAGNPSRCNSYQVRKTGHFHPSTAQPSTPLIPRWKIASTPCYATYPPHSTSFHLPPTRTHQPTGKISHTDDLLRNLTNERACPMYATPPHAATTHQTKYSTGLTCMNPARYNTPSPRTNKNPELPKKRSCWCGRLRWRISQFHRPKRYYNHAAHACPM